MAAGHAAGEKIAAGGTAGRVNEIDEDRGQHAQAQREPRGIDRIAPDLRGFREARPFRLSRFGDESPRHGLRRPQDGKDEEADGQGPAGGALGKQRKRNEQGRDAKQRPIVLQCTVHAGPPHTSRRFYGGPFGRGMDGGRRKAPGD